MSYPQIQLGKIAAIKGGKRLPKGEELIETETEHPYIRAQDIRNGRITFNEPRYITSEVHKRIKNYTVKSKDVCITIVGANVGDVGIVPPFLDGANLTENAVKLINLKDCDPVFLNYSLLGPGPQSQMKLLAAGAAQPKLGLYKVADIDIFYPALPTQRKIAAILSTYDDLIENNTRRIAILEEMAQTLYREWFAKFRFPGHEGVRLVESELGPVPEGWMVGRLDDALILQRGFDLPKDQRREGKVPVYAATGITDYHDEIKVKAPGVVTGRSGSLGQVMYIDEDYWPLNTALWVKEFRRVTPLYAFYLLSGLGLEQYNSGVAVPTLNRNDIHGLPVILPPLKLLKRFNENVLPMFELKKNLQIKNTNLRRTRDLLLPWLISGEVEVAGLEIAGRE